MAYTPVPTVVDGDDIIDDWGNAVSAAVTELQTGYPLAYTTWSAPFGSGVTTTSGTMNARYSRIGPLVFCTIYFILGASSAVTGDIGVTLPVDAAQRFTGQASFGDTGTARYKASVEYLSTTTCAIRPIGVGGTWATTTTAASGTVPFTWTTTDDIIASFWYWGIAP